MDFQKICQLIKVNFFITTLLQGLVKSMSLIYLTFFGAQQILRALLKNLILKKECSVRFLTTL
jgi:hypothetical protein